MAFFAKDARSNYGKSIRFSMQKALEERNPAIHGFLESNSEFFTNIRDTLRDLRKGQARLDRVFNLDDDDRQLLDLAKNAPDKLVQQLKTGKLGMSEKEEAKLMGMEDMDMDMDDFNLGDDDDIGTDDAMDDLKDLLGDIKTNTDKVSPMEKTAATIGEAQIASSKETTKAVIGGAKMTANAISTLDKHMVESRNVFANGIANSNKLQANIAVSRAKLEQTLHNKTMQGINTINENLANMVEFNNNIIGKFTDTAAQYYTDSLEELRKISSTLERAYPVREKEERESTYSKLGLDTDRVLNLSEYTKVLKSNFENTMIGGTISAIANPMVLGQILANPIGFALENVIDSYFPKVLDTAMKEMNKTFKEFVPALLGKAARIGETSTNPIYQFLGELFGINPGSTEKNIGKYEKGAVPFDGITHRSINVVIPTYLSQIVALLSGSQAQIYDHKTGKFRNIENVKQEKEQERESDVRSAMGYDIYDEVSKALDDYDFGRGKDRKEEKAKYQNQINTIIKKMAQSGKNSIDIHNRNEIMSFLGDADVDDEVLDWFVNTLKGTKDEKGRRRSAISAKSQMRLSALAHHYSDARQRRFRNEEVGDYLYDLVSQGFGEKKVKRSSGPWSREDFEDEEQLLSGPLGLTQLLFSKEARDKYVKDINKRKEKERKKAKEGQGEVTTAESTSPLGLSSLFGGGAEKLTETNNILKSINKDTNAIVSILSGGAPIPPLPPGGEPPEGDNPPSPNGPTPRRPKLGTGHLLNEQGKWRVNSRMTDEQRKAAGAGFYLDNKGRWVYRGDDKKTKVLISAKAAAKMSEEDILNKLYGEMLYSGHNLSAERIASIAGYTDEQKAGFQDELKKRLEADKAAERAKEIDEEYKKWKKEKAERDAKKDPERIEEERQEQESFLDRLSRIMKSPAEALASALNSVNEGMYTLLFGDAAADEFERPRGMIQLIKDTLKEGFKGVTETIAKEFWDPLKRMLFSDFQNGGLWKSIRHTYNNFVNNLPWNSRDEEGNPPAPPKPNAAGSGRIGPFGAPHFATGRPSIQSTGGKLLVNGRWRNVNKLTEEERKAATTGFYRDANGQLVMMHAGETEIVPAHQTVAGQKVDAKDENAQVVALYKKAVEMGNDSLANQILKLTELTKEQLEEEIKIKEATTKTADEAEKANKANEVEKKESEKTKTGDEKVQGVGAYAKGMLKDVASNVAAHIFGSEPDKDGKYKPVAEQIADMFAKGGRTLTKYFFGDNHDTDRPVEEYKAAFKKAIPRGIGRGIVIGGGLGLASMATALGGSHGFGLLGSIFLPGGPIGSMIVGLGAGLALENKQFREWLFGKVDEKTGKRVGGKASDIANFVERNKKTILGGAAVGLAQGLTGVSVVGSLLSMLPGGAAVGFLPALGVGILGPVTMSIGAALALNSETFKKAMFGSLDERTGKRTGALISRKTMDEFKSHVPQIATGAAIGGLAGLVGSNMGIIGMAALGPWNAALVGGAVGFMASSKRFRETLFGKQDETGKFVKGGLADIIKNFVMTEIGTPMKLFFKKEIIETKGWFKKKVLAPLAFAFPIYKRALGKAFESATRGIRNVLSKLGDRIEKALGPVGKMIRKFFVGMFDVMRKSIGGSLHKMFDLARTLISSPVALLTLPAKAIASDWRHNGTDEDKAFMADVDKADIERQAKYNVEYKGERAAFDLENQAHDVTRSNMRNTGYAATPEQLAAKTQAWREAQARKEQEEQEKQRKILEDQNEHLKNIDSATDAMAHPNKALKVNKSSITANASKVLSNITGNANSIENQSPDTIDRNNPSTNSILSRIKQLAPTMAKFKFGATKGKRKPGGSGFGGGAMKVNKDTAKKANAVELLASFASSNKEEKANDVEDVDRIDRDTSNVRADAIVKERKEDAYRDKIIKALLSLKDKGKEAIKKTKSFFEQLMDFLKGMAAFGGVLALLGWLKNFLTGKDETTGHETRATRDLAHIATRRAARSTVGRMLEDAAKKKAGIRAAERKLEQEALEKAAKDGAEGAEEKAAKKGLLQKGKEKLTALGERVGNAKKAVVGYGKAAMGIAGDFVDDLYYGAKYGDRWRMINKEVLAQMEEMNGSWLKKMKDKAKGVTEAIGTKMDKFIANIDLNVTALSDNIALRFSNVKDTVGKFIDNIGESITKHAGGAIEFGKNTINAARELPGMAAKQVGEVASGAWGYVKQAGAAVAKATEMDKAAQSANELVVQPAKDIAKKAVGGFEWFVQKCKGAIGAVINNPTVQKFLGSNASQLGEKFTKMLSNLNPKNYANIAKKVAKAISNNAAAIGTAGLAQLAFSVYDAYSGANDAGDLWGVKNEDVTPGMRTAAVIVNVIMGLGPMVWVDLALEAIYLGSSMLQPNDPINIKRQILKWVYECLPDVSEEDLKALDEKQSAVDKEYAEYVKQEYIKFGGKTEEEFNAMSQEEQEQYINTQKKAMEEQGKSVKSKDAFLHEKNKDDNFVLSTLRDTAIGKFLTGYNDDKGNYVPGLFSKLDKWFFGEDITDENGQVVGKKEGAWHKIKETAIWLGDKIWTVVKGVAKFVDGVWDFVLNKSFDEKLEFLWKKVFFGGYNDEGKYEKAFIPEMIDKICEMVTNVKDAAIDAGKKFGEMILAGDLKGIARTIFGLFGWDPWEEGDEENAGLVSKVTKGVGDFLSNIASTIEGTIKWWVDYWNAFWSAPTFAEEGKNNGKWDIVKQMFFGLKPGESLIPGLWRKMTEKIKSFVEAIGKKFDEIREWWKKFSLKDSIIGGIKSVFPKFGKAIEDSSKRADSMGATDEIADAWDADHQAAQQGATGRGRSMKNIHPLGGGAMTMPSGGFKQTGAGVSNTKLLDGSSMKDMGCGPTGVATALSSLGIPTDPNRTAATLSSSDMASNGTGVLPSGIAHMVNANGGHFTPIDPSNKRAIKAAQDANLPIITGGSRADGISTSAGHYNVVIGDKTHDPLGRASRTVTPDSISRTATSSDGKLGMLGVVTGGSGWAYGGGGIEDKVQEGINAYLGKPMVNGTKGCAEAVGKMGAYWSPFLKKMRDNGVMGVEGILDNAQKDGIKIVKYSDNALSPGDSVTYDNGTPRNEVRPHDDDAHNNHIGVYSGMKDGKPFGADNSSGKLQVVARPIHRNWQNPAWIIKTGDPNAKGDTVSGTSGSSSGKSNGMGDFFSKFATVVKDFGMSLLAGKVYEGSDFGNSSSSSSSSSGSAAGKAPGKGRENLPSDALPHYADVAERASKLSGIPMDWIYAQWANEAGRNFDSRLARENHNLAGVTVTSSMPGTVSGGMRWGLWDSDEAFADYWGGKYIKLWDGSTTAKTMKEYVHNLQNQPDNTKYCADPPEEEKYYANMKAILGNEGTVINGGSGLFGGGGNALKMGAQSGSDCTLYSAAALWNAYNGTELSPSNFSFGDWYGRIKGMPATEYDFSRHQKGAFEDTLANHFDKHPDYPVYLYQTGGDGHGKHPINRGSGNHATIIGRKMDDGRYQIFDSNGGVTHELPLEQIFDPTAKGSSSNGTGESDANLLLIPNQAPTSPITEWVASNGSFNGQSSGTESKTSPKSGKSGKSDPYGGYFSKLQTILKDYTMSLLTGKPYTGSNFSDSGSASSSVTSANITGQNAKDAWNYFKKVGFSNPETAGILGNLQAESGMDPNKLEGGKQLPEMDDINSKKGYGLAQWTYYSRKQGLKDYAASKGTSTGDMGTQLEYIWKEAQKTGVVEAMHKADQNPETQAKIWMDMYEKPGVPHWENRKSYAEQFMQHYGQGGSGKRIHGGGDGPTSRPYNYGFKAAISSMRGGSGDGTAITPKNTYISSATDRYTQTVGNSNDAMINAIRQLDIHAEMRELITIMRENTNNQSKLSDSLKKASSQMHGGNMGGAPIGGNQQNGGGSMKGAKMPEGKPGGPNEDMKRGTSGTNSYEKIHAKNLEIAKGGSFSTMSGSK